METTPASSVDHTTTQLNGTTIHKLLINGAYTYVNEVNGEYFTLMILQSLRSSLTS